MINRLHRDYPGARAGVFATVGDVDDLVRDLERRAVPVFRPSVFSFSRYDAEEIPGIFREQTGSLTSGTVSAAVRNDMRSATRHSSSGCENSTPCGWST